MVPPCIQEEKIILAKGNRKARPKGGAIDMAMFEVMKKESLDDVKCISGCPAKIEVPRFLDLAEKGKFTEALSVIRKRNPFPSITGRVCPAFCEVKCRRSEVDSPVAINPIERFVSEKAKANIEQEVRDTQSLGKRVAIVGSGPAGLSAGYYLARLGYGITVFEAMSVPGGMMALGIPEYRLPRDVLRAEIQALQELGVEIRLNSPVGINGLTLEHLRDQGYEAIFLAIGAHKPAKLDIPGEEFGGVIHGSSWLRIVNLGEKPKIGRRVLVIGGGNVAIDSARTAMRLGAKEVSIVYRRTRDEMPAIHEEIEEAKKEGIGFYFLSSPCRIISEEDRCVGIECFKTELGKLDENGRKTPLRVQNSEFVIDTDLVITAIGEVPDLSCLELDKFEVTQNGTLSINPDTMATNFEGVFAGGDVTSGSATIIEAVAAGRKAAYSIDKILSGKTVHGDMFRHRENGDLWSGYDQDILEIDRLSVPLLNSARRVNTFTEVKLGLEKDVALQEARRCLHCDQQVKIAIDIAKCTNCYTCQFVCSLVYQGQCNIEKARIGIFSDKISYTKECIAGCSLCVQHCPQDAIALGA